MFKWQATHKNTLRSQPRSHWSWLLSQQCLMDCVNNRGRHIRNPRSLNMSVCWWSRHSLDMDILSVLDFLNKPEVKDGLEETARLYFTSDTVTINLVWSAIILGLLGLGKLSHTCLHVLSFTWLLCVSVIKFLCQCTTGTNNHKLNCNENIWVGSLYVIYIWNCFSSQAHLWHSSSGKYSWSYVKRGF